jgi:hypothetical protein
MNQKDIFNLLRTVQSNVKCPQCGKPYDYSRIKIRGILDKVCFLELNCTTHMPLIATVMLPFNKDVKNRQIIEANDVIEVYKILKSFKGGFKNILL